MVKFRTITARYAGTCRRCHGAIQAGQKIRYGERRGMTYHLKSECGKTNHSRTSNQGNVRIVCNNALTSTENVVNDQLEREAYHARREYDETCHGKMTSEFRSLEADLDSCPF